MLHCIFVSHMYACMYCMCIYNSNVYVIYMCIVYECMVLMCIFYTYVYVLRVCVVYVCVLHIVHVNMSIMLYMLCNAGVYIL